MCRIRPASFVIRGMRPLHEHPQMAALFDSTCRAVFEAVARSPARVPELACALALPAVEVQRCLAELVGAGLVSPLRGQSYRPAAPGIASAHRAIESAWVERLAAIFYRNAFP